MSLTEPAGSAIFRCAVEFSRYHRAIADSSLQLPDLTYAVRPSGWPTDTSLAACSFCPANATAEWSSKTLAGKLEYELEGALVPVLSQCHFDGLERQNKIDNGSAESSCNGPHRWIEAVLNGLSFG